MVECAVGVPISANHMEKEIQRKSSKLPEGVVPGCFWGLSHSFDIHLHLRLKKLLGQRRNASTRHAMGIKVGKETPPAGGEDYVTESETNITTQVEDGAESANKDSGKAPSRVVISREIPKQHGKTKKKGQKQKANPYARRLLRTISIHHMECDDYVLPGEMTGDGKVQDAGSLSHNSHFSASNDHMPLSPKTASEVNQCKRCELCGMLSGAGKYLEHNHLDVLVHQLVEYQTLVREKLKEAKNKSQEYQTVDGKDSASDVALDHSKDFLDALELFNASRELLLKILHEQSVTITNYLLGQEGSRTGRVLRKSGSFPGAGFSGRSAGPLELKHKGDETIPLNNRERKSDTKNSQTLSASDSTEVNKSPLMVNALEPVSDVCGIDDIASNSECSSSLMHVMKCQRDNGTAAYRFKDIKQRIKDMVEENNKEKHRISMDGILHKIPYGCKGSQEKLSPWKGPITGWCDGDGSRNSSASDRAGPTHRNETAHMRSLSLTESMDRYSYLLEFNFNKEPKRQVSERLKLVPEECVSHITNSPKTFGRMLSLPEFDSSFLAKYDQSDSLDGVIHSRSISVDLGQGNATMRIKGTDEQTIDISDSSLKHINENIASPVNRDTGGSMSVKTIYAASNDLETEKIASVYAASNDLDTEKITSTHLNEQEVVSHMEWSDKPAEPSPISVLDSYLPEDVVSPAEFSTLRGSSELKPKKIHFGELDSFDSPENHSDISDSGMVETDALDVNEIQNPGAQPDFDILHVPLSNTHEFHVVRDVLKKYCIHGDEHFATWHSPLSELSSSIFEEAGAPLHELESNNTDSGINLEHGLLFDLTNEVLWDIYESSYGHCPWLSHSCSRMRPMPEYHALEEVWANINRYLKFLPQADHNLEYITNQDLKKNDQWMKLHYDIEYLGQDLGVLIFDDLLHEAVIECFSQQIAS